MRSEPQIRAMHDELERMILRDGGECDRTAFTALDWVCNTLVPDSELTEAIDRINDDIEVDVPDAENALHLLPEVMRADDLDDAKDYLHRLSGTQIEGLAAAARRLDRLCKTELKGRVKAQ
jgi:hypothetical protein